MFILSDDAYLTIKDKNGEIIDTAIIKASEIKFEQQQITVNIKEDELEQLNYLRRILSYTNHSKTKSMVIKKIKQIERALLK